MLRGLHYQLPPKAQGSAVEDVEVLEGETLTLRCEMSGKPQPELSWTKDGAALASGADVQLLADNGTVYVAEAARAHRGTYFCKARNDGGVADKTFNVRVVLKPTMLSEDDDTRIEVIVGAPVTFDCPVESAVGVTFAWLRHGQPVVDGGAVKVLTQGRHLHIGETRRADAGSYACTVKNRAGQGSKRYTLVVLVPPSILGTGGHRSVIENGTLVLPCETDGFPTPVVTWTKDGQPVVNLANVEVLSNGQQFRISQAAPAVHQGGYLCVATNPVGTADLEFDVDVICEWG